MKYLELPSLIDLNSTLRSIGCGQVRIVARVEAFSCKPAGGDKSLYWSLEKELSRSPAARSPPARSPSLTASSSVEASTSPFGPLTEKASRKIFIFLISTLNHCFPDYDFRRVKADDFKKEALPLIMNHINTTLNSTIDNYNFSLRNKLWQAIDSELSLKDCNVYSFVPDPDANPFADEANVWSFNYFFYNAKLKRVALLTCRAVSIVQDYEFEDEDEDEYNEAGFVMEF